MKDGSFQKQLSGSFWLVGVGLILFGLFLFSGCVTTYSPSQEGLLLVGVSSERSASKGERYLDYRLLVDGGKYRIPVESWKERVLVSSIPPGEHRITQLSYVFQDNPSKRGRLQSLDIPFEIRRGEVTVLSHELSIRLVDHDNSAGYLKKGSLEPLSADVLQREHKKLARDERLEGFRLPELRFIEKGGALVNTAGMLGNAELPEIMPEGVPDKEKRVRFLYTFCETPAGRKEILDSIEKKEMWKPMVFAGNGSGEDTSTDGEDAPADGVLRHSGKKYPSKGGEVQSDFRLIGRFRGTLGRGDAPAAAGSE